MNYFITLTINDCHRVILHADNFSFGLSKDQTQSDEKFMRTRCGTPSYVAPEIIQAEPYTNTVDIWSLGVVFHLMWVFYEFSLKFLWILANWDFFITQFYKIDVCFCYFLLCELTHLCKFQNSHETSQIKKPHLLLTIFLCWHHSKNHLFSSRFPASIIFQISNIDPLRLHCSYPFSGYNMEETHEKVLTGVIEFSDDVTVTSEAKDLIMGMLKQRSEDRLTIQQIKDHPWVLAQLKGGSEIMENLEAQKNGTGVAVEAVAWESNICT